MSRTIRLILAATLLAVSSMGIGCGRLIKEGAGVALGPKGLVAPIAPIAAKDVRPLGEYQCFALGEITDGFAGKVPQGFWQALPTAFEKELASRKLPAQPGGKTLVVCGTVLHYEDASMLANAFGPLEEVVARIKLVDKDTGKVVGEANCIGRTTESVNLGAGKKADGLAKAIVSWIASHYPLPEKETK